MIKAHGRPNRLWEDMPKRYGISDIYNVRRYGRKNVSMHTAFQTTHQNTCQMECQMECSQTYTLSSQSVRWNSYLKLKIPIPFSTNHIGKQPIMKTMFKKWTKTILESPTFPTCFFHLPFFFSVSRHFASPWGDWRSRCGSGPVPFWRWSTGSAHALTTPSCQRVSLEKKNYAICFFHGKF